MKKVLSLFLAVTVIFAFASCAKKAPEESSTGSTSANASSNAPAEITIDLTAVKNSIIEKAGLTDPLEIETENLCELYGIDPSDVSEAVCVTTLDGTFPDEAIIIKAANKDAKQRITEKLTSHLDDVKVQSQNYDAENYALAQECKIIENGNYLALFISAKHAQMEQIFTEAFNK